MVVHHKMAQNVSCNGSNKSNTTIYEMSISELVKLGEVVSEDTLRGKPDDKTPGLEVIKLEFILKLKIKCNDWLLADLCLQATNHCALFCV